MKKLWIWNWQGGGYNSVQAETREEAIAIGNRMHPACIVDEPTVHEGTSKELFQLDRQYASMCD